MTATPQHFCTFAVGELLVGVEVERVREILGDQELTPVPLAHPSVLGLLSLRGEIVTAIDARRRLGLKEPAPDRDVAHVILWSEGDAVSLVVDAERDVVELDTATVEVVPETVRAEIRNLLTGIYRLESGALMLVLDPDLTVSLTAT
jgi:purine-binding chemotaxis protein CheW